eukprot:TRINITY_DN10489_c0_g1_i1.p1 TRINITY_DN10489_c0_g1~~TRINITY_DN10489_c0_g1_i1.p1  ORF type:complete len:127 (+),score=49.74 TRINITY_DN10489_c0_g1_i1:58-381(+)
MGLGDVAQNLTVFSPGLSYAAWGMTMAPLMMLMEGFFRARARKPPPASVSPRYVWRNTVAFRVTKKFLPPQAGPARPVVSRIPADLANLRSDAQSQANLAQVVKMLS